MHKSKENDSVRVHRLYPPPIFHLWTLTTLADRAFFFFSIFKKDSISWPFGKWPPISFDDVIHGFEFTTDRVRPRKG